VRRFAVAEPGSLKDASGILAREGAEARILAGGIDLLGELKDRLIFPRTLVNLKAVPGLEGIRFAADGTLRVGALSTLTALADHDRVRSGFPAIAQAALSVGSPEIRNVGTVGGNLCQRPRCWYYRSPLHKCLKKGGDICFTIAGESRYHAILGGGPSFIVHPSDLAPALVACDARVAIAGPRGPREMPLERFFVLPSERIDHETVLQAGEIVTEVIVPPSASTAGGRRSAFLKFKERDSFDFALVSVAASLKMSGRSCVEARLVLGGVAPIPWRSVEAEKEIVGGPIDAAAAGRAAGAALKDAAPLEHNGYKVPLAQALIRRALLDLAGASPDLTPS
jgi:xanthine dehydrogenase YagS FAD-binding subunit